MFTIKYFPNNEVAEITAPTLSGFKELCEFVGYMPLKRKRDTTEEEEVVVVENAPTAQTQAPKAQTQAQPVLQQPVMKRKTSLKADDAEDKGFFGDVTTFFNDIVVHGRLTKPVCLKNIFFPHEDAAEIFEDTMLNIGSQFFEFDFKVVKRGLDIIEWKSAEDYEQALTHLAESDFGNGGMLIIPSAFHSMFAHEFRKDLFDTIVEKCRVIKVEDDPIGKAICGGFANIFIQNKHSKPLAEAATNAFLNRKDAKGRRLFGWVNLGPEPAKQVFSNEEGFETIEVPVGHAVFYDESHNAKMPGKISEDGMFNIRMYFNFFISHELRTDSGNLGTMAVNAATYADMPAVDRKSKDGKTRLRMSSYPCVGASLKELGKDVQKVYPGLYREELTKDHEFSPAADQWDSEYYNRHMCDIYGKNKTSNGYFGAMYFNNEYL